MRIQEKLDAHPGKTTRRVGKIGRRKVFSEVKNVNVESLKNDSKLLDFWSGSLPQPLPKGKGFSKAYPNPSLKGRAFQTSTWGSPLMPINCPINFWTIREQFMFKKSIHGQFVNNSWTLMFQKRRSFRLSPLVSLSLWLFVSLTLNVGFVYSLCIVCASNYTFRNARQIREM